MSFVEQIPVTFVEKAKQVIRTLQAEKVRNISNPLQRDKPGLCHELYELVDGQGDLIEDLQMAALYSGMPASREEIEEMLLSMDRVREIAQKLYDEYGCNLERARLSLKQLAPLR